MNQRVVVLTGTDLRHRYFLWRLLNAGVNVAGVVFQHRPPEPIMDADLPPDDRALLEYHFGLRDRMEEQYFGHAAGVDPEGAGAPLLRVPQGAVNEPDTIRFVRECRPDTIVVYGTGLLKEEILSICPDQTVNLHLGLSPYYRGAATIFWPLHDERPEYVGATIHRIDLRIDTGPIYHHARPEIAADDNPHDIGCKSVMSAADAMLRTLWELERGDAVAVPQWDKGQVFLRRNFLPEHARKVYGLLEDGMLARWLENKDRVYHQVRLVG